MIVSDLTAILDVLRNASSFAITTHTNPDGDAIGSVLGMQHFLHALGKERIVCVNDDPVPRIYQWLPGAESFQRSQEVTAPIDVEVVVIVDAGRLDRVGAAANVFPATAKYVVLDHHIEEHPDGDLGQHGGRGGYLRRHERGQFRLGLRLRFRHGGLVAYAGHPHPR